MTDYLVRGMTADKHIRFFGVNAKQTVQTAVDMHNLSILNSVVLGRMLISGLLMGGDLKNSDDLLTLRIDGDGVVGSVIITATGEGTVKGYVQNPQVELPLVNQTFPVAQAIGNGTLSVIKSLGDAPPYVGQVELVTGEIGDDISYYYHQSEQIDTIVNLGILIDPNATIEQAGGILVQCLPDTPDSVVSTLYENAKHFPNLSDFMDLGYTIEEILEKHIFKNIPIDIFGQKPITYKCNCDKERFYRGLKLLGEKEIQELIDHNETITAECHFCDKKYRFTIEELKEMIKCT